MLFLSRGSLLLAMRSIIRSAFGVLTSATLRRDQRENTDPIAGVQMEHEAGSAAMVGFAHRPVLLAPTEDAFDTAVSIAAKAA